MKTIFKYPLTGAFKQTIKMPEGAEILCAQLQNGVPTLWAKVNDSNELKDRVIEVYGTGVEVNEYDLDYIGTVQDFAGLVWHVFENK